MKRSIALLLWFLWTAPAEAATNLPAVCSSAAAEGQGVAACASAAQSFAEAQNASLVRACNAVNCTYAQRTWRKLSDVTAAQFVEVCAADKAPGAPLTECQGATTSQWGAMVMVPRAQVALAVEPEPAFPGTFTATPSSGNSPLTIVLAWNVTLAGATCVASGSWNGDKPLTGSQTITNLRANASYTLRCSRTGGGGAGEARLSWTIPTQNTDGTPLTNLSGFRISYGRAASELTQSLDVQNPALMLYTVTNLDAGTWYFGIRAHTLASESTLSNIVTKIVGATTESYSATRAVTVVTVPQAPTLQVVDAAVYNAAPDYSILAFRPSLRYGAAPIGTPCDDSKPVRGGYFPVPLDAVHWATSARTKYPIARCSLQ